MQDTSKKQFRKDVIWNAISSTTNGMVNMLISFFVINFIGSDIGGIFGFGFSTLGQQIFILSYFGIRIFQVIDISYKYDFNIYIKHRRITFAASVVFLLFYMVIYYKLGIYSLDKCMILVLICTFKAIEGLFDVYECELQRKHKLYLACQFNFARVSLSTFILLSILYVCRSQDLKGVLSALIVFIAFQISFGAIFLNTKKDYFVSEGPALQPAEKILKLKSLTKEVLPIFLATFLDFWIFSLSKYALDVYSDNHTTGMFNILFMPATLMYLFVNFFLRPYLSTLADCQKNNDKEGFDKVVHKMYIIAFGVAVLGFVSVLLVGKPVLSVIDMLTGYRYNDILLGLIPLLLIIIFGGFIYTLVNIRYSILAIKNKQKTMLYCYGIILVVGIILAWMLTSRFGIYGAASSFASTMMILLALLFMIK
jgi:O-antigen/teichoic acid export membrane protein